MCYSAENTEFFWHGFSKWISYFFFLGYGHIVPATPVGKLATIFYAIFGIPLFLLYLSNIGDIMAKSFKFIYSRICKCQRDHKPPEQIPSGILKKPDSYRIQMLPQHVHGLSQAGVPGGPEESTSSMASGMIGKISTLRKLTTAASTASGHR